MGAHAKVYAATLLSCLPQSARSAQKCSPAQYPQPEHSYGMKGQNLDEFLNLLEKA